MNNLISKINRLRTRVGMTLGDGILLCSIIFFALLSFPIMPRWMLAGGKVLEIRAGDKIVGRYSLNNHRLVKVPRAIGDNFGSYRERPGAHSVFSMSS